MDVANGKLLSFLEGGAGSISTAGCAAGTYCDLLGGAVRLTIVVNTVLYVTANALDMILAGVRRTILFVVAVHASFLLCKNNNIIHQRRHFIHFC